MKTVLRVLWIFLKTVLRGLLSVIAVVFFVTLVVIVISLIVFAFRYETWRVENTDMIEEVAIAEVENRDAVESELNKRLGAFQQSTVQKESMTLTCDMVNVLMENVLEESWKLEHSETGVTCGERTLTVYLKLRNLWWVSVKVWQRAEGSVEFVVYDVNIGPFSVAGATYGYLSEEMSRGVKDAIALVSSESYSGRKIENLYLEESGMRMVGVLEKVED